jgi:cysteinyl-tRNA synthetase
MLRLYNTLTRAADEFQAINPPLVRLYTCGPTVYNFAHVGNLRTYVFEDVLKRVLRTCGLNVRHVMNVTDVGHLTSDADQGEDKMALGAAREGKTVWEIAEFYWQAFRNDIRRLNILEPDVWCKATDHIAEQIELVRTLEAKGFTYVIPGDGVYFDTSKFPAYGRMARLDIAGLQAGARVEMAAGKRNATDFALWKFSPSDKQRLMEWPSPWGVGFPGWHIECSAMAIKHLGEYLDIHCGGIDHIQVHHTNEIAQSECALGHKWCNWWMHGEFLTFPKGPGGEAAKMSKSSGEFLTLDRLIDKGYDPMAYRYFLLTAHYRQQLAFTWEGLAAAAHALANLKRQALALKAAAAGAAPQPAAEHLAKFRQAVENDLNMPQALAAMWGTFKDAAAGPAQLYAALLAMDEVLGLGIADFKEDALGLSEQAIAQLIEDRKAARKAKDFARADAIRKDLAAQGVVLEDSPAGTTWRRA